MKHQVICFFVLMFLSVNPGSAQKPSNSGPLTNVGIVKLVKAGFSDKTVISIIGARPSTFDLSTEAMIQLKRSGVSERVILAMLSAQQGVVAVDENWAEDPFFDEVIGPKRDERSRVETPKQNASSDIFGSSGSARGETRSRGGNGSAVDDTVTTGSATVRIIKPAAEANAPAKLEKTPTLTNASIIELVNAGFSEGTIVRRIEQSAVEFDLSPNQLTELRKHRVSDKLLAAMQSAMGIEAGGNKDVAAPNEKEKKRKN